METNEESFDEQRYTQFVEEAQIAYSLGHFAEARQGYKQARELAPARTQRQVRAMRGEESAAWRIGNPEESSTILERLELAYEIGTELIDNPRPDRHTWDDGIRDRRERAQTAIVLGTLWTKLAITGELNHGEQTLEVSVSATKAREYFESAKADIDQAWSGGDAEGRKVRFIDQYIKNSMARQAIVETLYGNQKKSRELGRKALFYALSHEWPFNPTSAKFEGKPLHERIKHRSRVLMVALARGVGAFTLSHLLSAKTGLRRKLALYASSKLV